MFRTLLVLLALVTPSIAGSVGFDTGTFEKGHFVGSLKTGLDITLQGTLAEVNIDTGKLFQVTSNCPTGSQCFTFTGGLVSVNDGHFTDKIIGGIVISEAGLGLNQDLVTLSATLASETGVTSGAAVTTFDFSQHKITAGSADIVYNTPVPEPTAGAMLGLGLVGLVGLGRLVRPPLS